MHGHFPAVEDDGAGGVGGGGRENLQAGDEQREKYGEDAGQG